MKPLRSLLLLLVLQAGAASAADTAVAAPGDSGGPGAGTTIVGEQDAALGLYLMPWKDERPADLRRAPGLRDEAPGTLDAEDFVRTSTYYATGRAYRAERLQRNR